MTTENTPVERMEKDEFPFKDMQSEGHQWDIEEYINLPVPDEEAQEAVRKDEIIRLLGLSTYSTAEDVRRVAFKLRNQALITGVPTDKLNALNWALARTRDCIDESEFDRFIRFNWSFEEIRLGRNR